MALFKILKGASSNLPTTKTAGYCYFTTDTKLFYIDIDNSTRVVLNAEQANTLTVTNNGTATTLKAVVDNGTLSSSEVKVPTSKAVMTALATIQTDISNIQTILNNVAYTNKTNTYSGEQKFNNTNYSITAQDNASGVATAYKAGRGATNEEIVGQIIMPYTSVSNGTTANTKNTIKFQKISGVSSGTPTYSTVATLTDNNLDVPALSIAGTALSDTLNGITSSITGLDSAKITCHSWTAVVKGQTWSRLCYVTSNTSIVGTSFILNIAGTRSSVVYNDTFVIKSHHSAKANITKISGCNYSSESIRVLANSTGYCYVELYDSNKSITTDTTQSVYCRLIPIFAKEITKYTSFTDGTTLPDNFSVAASMTTNTNSLQGNLTWNEITGKPSTFTPATHNHDSSYVLKSGDTVSGNLTVSGTLYATTITQDPSSISSHYINTAHLRGSGTASSYYHALDIGIADSDAMTFHEKSGSFKFYKNTAGTSTGGTLIGSITSKGFEGSAALTGTPTAPTAATGTNTTQIATTAFVSTAVATAKTEIGTNIAKYLPLAGGTLTGKVNSSYTSSTWINSCLNQNSAFNLTATGGYVGWMSGPAKDGKFAISSYPGSTNLLYFIYMDNSTTANAYDKAMTWNGATGELSVTSINSSAKWGSSTVGGAAKPVYINAGTFTACSSTVGATNKPVYMSSGTITASTSTIGATNKPIYMSSGTITASTANIGSGTQPMYMTSGTMTASTSTVGATNKPVYLKSGVITASDSTIGATNKPVYMSSGVITASTSTIGGATTPVYMNSGTITACTKSFDNYLPLTGGTVTGATSFTAGIPSEGKASGTVKVTGGLGVSEQISADTVMVGDGVTLYYNSSAKSLDFIFAA